MKLIFNLKHLYSSQFFLHQPHIRNELHLKDTHTLHWNIQTNEPQAQWFKDEGAEVIRVWATLSHHEVYFQNILSGHKETPSGISPKNWISLM